MILESRATRVVSHKKQDMFGVDSGLVAEQRHATSRLYPKAPKVPTYPFTPSHGTIKIIVDTTFGCR